MKKLRYTFIAVCLIFAVNAITPAYSQCSMCRAVAESGAKDDKTRVARGLNTGILYLLSIPYIIGGVGYYVWRKNRRKQAGLQ